MVRTHVIVIINRNLLSFHNDLNSVTGNKDNVEVLSIETDGQTV